MDYKIRNTILIILCVLIVLVIPFNTVNAVGLNEEIMVTNLITNGNFASGVTGWTTLWNVTIESTGGINNSKYLKINGDYLGASSPVSIISGHKYYIVVNAKILGSFNGQKLSINLRNGDTSVNTVYISMDNSANAWYKYDNLITASGNANNIRLLTYIYESGVYTGIDDVYIVDLTDTFGAGNEPDVGACDLLFNEYWNGEKGFILFPSTSMEDVFTIILGSVGYAFSLLDDINLFAGVSLFDMMIGILVLFIITKYVVKIGVSRNDN